MQACIIGQLLLCSVSAEEVYKNGAERPGVCCALGTDVFKLVTHLQ